MIDGASYQVKDRMFWAVKEMIDKMEKKTGRKVKFFRGDNASEFLVNTSKDGFESMLFHIKRHRRTPLSPTE